MFLLQAAALSVAQIPPALGPSWAEFSEGHYAPNVNTKVEIGTLGYDRDKRQLEFWLRRTVAKRFGHEVGVSWTTTRNCPAARSILASMRDIPVPKFAPIGTSKGPPIMLDGPSYKLHSYSDEGSLTAEAYYDEAGLARWIKSSLAAVNNCWSSAVPERIP